MISFYTAHRRMIAAGLAAILHGALPAWLGWIAVIIGVVSVMPVGFAALLAALAWVLVVSVLIAVREARTTGAAAR